MIAPVMTTAIQGPSDLRQRLLAIRSGATPTEMRERIISVCREAGYDPIAELIAVAQFEGNDLHDELMEMAEKMPGKARAARLKEIALMCKALGPDIKEAIGIHKEILKYLAPQLRSLDVSGQVDTDLNISIRTFEGEENGKIIDGETVNAKTAAARTALNIAKTEDLSLIHI